MAQSALPANDAAVHRDAALLPGAGQRQLLPGAILPAGNATATMKRRTTRTRFSASLSLEE